MSQQSMQASAPPTPEQIRAQFELAITLSIARWSSMAVAVANHWGGPDSADKRDWLCGELSELFAARPDMDEADVEDVLLQVMAEEFDTVLEDESEVAVAAEICLQRRLTLQGDFRGVQEMRRRWEERGGRTQGRVVVTEHGSEDGDDDYYDEHDDDDGDGDDDQGVALPQDEIMDDAPPLVPAREKQAPEMDEDGFQKVVGKKKK